eukprot:PhM_4_TR3018/c4_g3_i25/m.89632
MHQHYFATATLILLLVFITTLPQHTHAQFVRTPGATLRTCFLYFGTLTDLGYTYSFHSGRLAAQKELIAMYPDINIESVYENNVFFSNMNRTQNFLDYVQSGCHVIIANANEVLLDNDMNDFALWAARTYRNVSFVIGGDSNKPLTWPEPNMVFIGHDLAGAFYSAGVAAAHEAVNCIGVIAAYEDRIGINIDGFLMGVRSVKPTLPVHVATTDEWWWPDAEVRIAELFLNRSCNVIARNTDPRDVDLLVADRKTLRGATKYFSVAVHSDLQRFVGDSVLTATVVDWARVIVPWVSQVVTMGMVQQYPAPKFYGMIGGYVKSVPTSPLADPATQAAVLALGDVNEDNIFCGTIKLRDGRVHTPSTPGACMNITERRLFLTAYLDDPHVMYHPTPFRLETDCPAGTWYSYSQTGNITLTCTPCPANTFSTAVGSAACEPCAPGEESDPGSVRCRLIVDSASNDVIFYTIPIVIIVPLVLGGLGVVTMRARRVNRYAPRKPPLALMFTDIETSTELWQKYGDTMQVALDMHHEIIRKQIADYHGYEVKTVGDAFMIACCSPLDAALLATAIQQALQEATWPEKMSFIEGKGEGPRDRWNGVRVRIGVHYGHSVTPQFDAIHQRYDYYGHDVNVSARVEGETLGGQILISDDMADALSKEPDFPVLFPDGYVLCRENVELKGVDGVKTLYMLHTPGLEERLFPNIAKGGDNASNATQDHGLGSDTGSRMSSSMSERATLLRPVRALLGLCPKKHYDAVVGMLAEGCGGGGRGNLSVARKLVLVLSKVTEVLRPEALASQEVHPANLSPSSSLQDSAPSPGLVVDPSGAGAGLMKSVSSENYRREDTYRCPPSRKSVDVVN